MDRAVPRCPIDPSTSIRLFSSAPFTGETQRYAELAKPRCAELAQPGCAVADATQRCAVADATQRCDDAYQEVKQTCWRDSALNCTGHIRPRTSCFNGTVLVTDTGAFKSSHLAKDFHRSIDDVHRQRRAGSFAKPHIKVEQGLHANIVNKRLVPCFF